MEEGNSEITCGGGHVEIMSSSSGGDLVACVAFSPLLDWLKRRGGERNGGWFCLS